MPGRQFVGTRYKYGFNGKENDLETVSTGSGTQDYGMRIYNPALGKFLSVDPLFRNYAFFSPYLYAANNPIKLIDVDGKGAADPLLLKIGAESSIPNFVISKSSVIDGNLTQTSIAKANSYNLQRQTLYSKTSAMGVTSKADNAFKLGGGVTDEIAVANNGATQVAFAEQMVTLKGVPGMENLAVLEVTNEITIVSFDGDKITSIEKRIETKKQILLLSDTKTPKFFEGVADIVGEDNKSSSVKINPDKLTKSQVNFVQSTITSSQTKRQFQKAQNAANKINDAFNKKSEDAKNATYKENKGTMIRDN